jgi:SAM-dependent methyltransferase
MAVNLINPQNGKPLVDAEGGLIDEDRNFFPYKDDAYRIARDEGYAASFGYEWNKFQWLQIDKFNGTTQSRDRFFAVTNWDELSLRAENILNVGSGAGRFTQVVLDFTEANLYNLDYSAAVEANFRNNASHPRLKLFEANIYELPFEKESFDRVVCSGTLQHTQDVRKSVSCLIDITLLSSVGRAEP